jgi:G3E family GTPase
MIPITIITGFLWSGKTTLLNHIIREAKGRKIAVVENEFWSAWIDGTLIERSIEEIIEISDGCMCCTVRKDFIEAIERLLASGKLIDHIIIECSGMSDPLPVAQSFLMNDMWWRVKLDSIICVMDAENINHKIVESTQTTLDQIEFADFIIINKSETLSAEGRGFMETIIRRVNAFAPIIYTSYGQVDLDLLLDTGRIDPEWESTLREADPSHEHRSDITQYIYKNSGVFSSESLNQFFLDLPYDIYRVKGYIHLWDHPDQTFILQKAGARFTLTESPEYKNKDNILVFIGVW